jgi:sulfite reductase (NADPH) flavoprotein alpha-component
LIVVVSSSQLVFEQLCSYDEYCKVQRLVIHASKSLEPCTLSQFRLSEHDMNLSSLSEQVNLVFVTHIPLLKTYDIVGNLRHGGTLVINTSLGADELSAFLPSCVKMHLEALSISVYVVDAHQIASDFTIFYGCKDKFERMVLESVLYHFIFADEPAKAKRMLFEQRERIIKSSANYNESYTANESVRTGLGSIRKIQIVHESLSGQENKSVLYKPKAYVAGTHPLPETEPVSLCSVSNDTVRLQMAFPAAYKLKPVSLPIGTFRVKVSANMRLTPDSYDRNVFHIELDTTGTGLKYEIGEALSVHCPNDINNVSSFITKHNFDSKQILAILSEATEECPSYCEMNTLEQLLINTIDIFGKPGRKFYNYLMQKMNSDDEKETLAKLMQNDSTFESFIETDTPTFADLIERFPSAILTAQDIVREVPVIKPRLYSISSSQRVHENSIHLLVVLVDWKGSAGVMRYGHATRFLMNAKLGEYLTVSIKPSVMKLPHSHESPVIMSGLGTGMAPFRAFIEERWYWKQQGKKVGPMILYFGSRYREMEYLYGEELDAYLNENILTSLRLAFSRDQKEKVYIQHKIEQDSDILHDLICNKNASFYLCGPTWPVPDISTALLSSFSKTMTPEKAEAYLEKMKDDERYILEVY